MKRALAISAGLHVALGAVLLSVELREGDPGTAEIAQPIAIEIIAPVRNTPPLDVEGGGSFRSPEAAPATSNSKSIATPAATSTAPSTTTEAPTPPSTTASVEASTEESIAPPTAMTALETTNTAIVGTTSRASSTRARSTSRGRAASTTDNPFGDVDRALHPVAANNSTDGSDRDGDGGEGFGSGGERGDGIGFGNGGRIAVADDQLTMPPPQADVPPPSKARPAKLVYPSRTRDLGEDKLFVARITVDTDGYVVGARLVKGRNGPRDDEAADLIFRFRYLPALDDAGRAIKSTFEQPFHVNR